MQVIVVGQDRGQDYLDLVEFCSVRGIKLVEEKVTGAQQRHAAEGEAKPCRCDRPQRTYWGAGSRCKKCGGVVGTASA